MLKVTGTKYADTVISFQISRRQSPSPASALVVGRSGQFDRDRPQEGKRLPVRSIGSQTADRKALTEYITVRTPEKEQRPRPSRQWPRRVTLDGYWQTTTSRHSDGINRHLNGQVLSWDTSHVRRIQSLPIADPASKLVRILSSSTRLAQLWATTSIPTASLIVTT